MIETAAFAAMDVRLDPASPAPMAVAVSGGGDSMALLALASEWAGRHRRQLLVLTVDHGLNPDSGRWAAFVADAARRLGASVQVLLWAGPRPATGLPAAARTARHALLADAAREAGARVILMGHTVDDLFEAARMRAGGSSVGAPRAWAPSPAWPEGRGVFLLRPLLDLPRTALRTWLQAEGATWIEDPANADPRFARSRARQSAAEAGSRGESPHPAAPRPSPLAKGEGAGLVELTRSSPFLWLGPALTCASGGARIPDAAAVERLARRIAAGEDFTSTLSGARLEAAGDRILIGREPGRRGIPPLRVGPGGHIWDGRFEIETDEAGTILPLTGRLAQLPPADRAQMQHLPPWQRPTLPVLLTAHGLRTVRKRCLVYERWLAACGAFTRECELPSPDRGATPAEGLSVSGKVRSGLP